MSVVLEQPAVLAQNVLETVSPRPIPVWKYVRSDISAEIRLVCNCKNILLWVPLSRCMGNLTLLDRGLTSGKWVNLDNHFNPRKISSGKCSSKNSYF